jgi:hypothetical protein
MTKKTICLLKNKQTMDKVDLLSTHLVLLTSFCYSLSSERLVDIKVTKFYVEQGVASARKI